MLKASILLIEDSEEIRTLLKHAFEMEGAIVREAAHAAAAIAVLKAGFKPDTILLDLMLPDSNGLDLLPALRDLTDAPVVVLTAKATVTDKVVGFELGADDYVIKPFQIQELKARIKAHVRRYRSKHQKKAQDTKLTFSGWVMDPERFQVFSEQGHSANLSPNEYALLDILVSAPGKVFSRAQLLDKTRGNDFDVTDRAIDTQITRIRKKLGDDTNENGLLQPVRGVGYYFSGKPVPVGDSGEN